MFETLTKSLNEIFQSITGKGRLSEKDIEETIRQVRLALLGADVNFKVTGDLLSRVKERAIGSEVLQSLSPGQQVIKILNEELTVALDGGDNKLTTVNEMPRVIMVVGLQGSGKTTTSAKLALQLKNLGETSLLIPADLRRPAAVDQLVALASQSGLSVFRDTALSTAVKTVANGIKSAQKSMEQWVIIDTAGRLHIDDELMDELEYMKSMASPHETLLVVDSMAGQDAVNSAIEFHNRLKLTGLIITKLDGDARGGAAISISQVTGLPIKFIGVGEKPGDLEPFHPDRLASRILGMGDVLSLIEKAESVIDKDKAKELEAKIRKSTFDLNDFLEQLQNVKRMGFMQVLELLPGFSSMKGKVPNVDENRLVKIEAIIQSMTNQERQNPDILNGRRRKRISAGSGTYPQDVNQLINQYKQASKLMKQLPKMGDMRGIGKFFG